MLIFVKVCLAFEKLPSSDIEEQRGQPHSKNQHDLISSLRLEFPNRSEMYWMVISSPCLMLLLALMVIVLSG